ncbi:hypothetical protein ACSQ67_024171 [Phaseolus vulgaris]
MRLRMRLRGFQLNKVFDLARRTHGVPSLPQRIHLQTPWTPMASFGTISRLTLGPETRYRLSEPDPRLSTPTSAFTTSSRASFLTWPKPKIFRLVRWFPSRSPATPPIRRVHFATPLYSPYSHSAAPRSLHFSVFYIANYLSVYENWNQRLHDLKLEDDRNELLEHTPKPNRNRVAMVVLWSKLDSIFWIR